MNKEGKLIAVLEIAGSSVSGILIRQNKENKKIEILAQSRLPVNFLFDVNFEAFWRSAKNALNKIVKNLAQNRPSKINAVFCVFLSPWFTPQIKIAEVKRENPFEITKDLLNELVKNEEKTFEAKKNSNFKNLEREFIEREIIKTELNGYYTQSPVGKYAATLKTYIYMSLGIKEAEEGVKKEVLDNFGDVPLTFRTFPLVSFYVMDRIFQKTEGMILVDIGGEMTDVSLVRKDCLRQVVSFPRGKNFIVRKACSVLNTFPHEAFSFIKTYLNGHSSEKDSEKISKILEEARNEWFSFFETAVKNISEQAPLPQNLFLLGDELLANHLIASAEDKKFSQLTVLGKPLVINKITARGLNHYFSFKEDKPLNIFLMMESLFANGLLGYNQ